MLQRCRIWNYKHVEKQNMKTENGTSTSEIAIKYYTTFNVETGIILIDL